MDATKKIVSRDPEVMGGNRTFADTRVEVKTRIDYLKASHSHDDFLEGFPTVGRDLPGDAPRGCQQRSPGELRLVVSRLGSGGDHQTVPCVDRGDLEHQLDSSCFENAALARFQTPLGTCPAATSVMASQSPSAARSRWE